MNRGFISFVLFFLINLYAYSQESEKKLSRFTFSLSIPMIHNNLLVMPDSVLNNTSFLGFSAGLGYYYDEENYIELLCGATISNEVPFPMAVDHDGSYESYNTSFIGLTTNHVVSSFLKKRLHYSIGLNYTYYDMTFFQDVINSPDISFNKRTLGATMGLKYNVFKHLAVGLKLNTSLYNFSSSKFEYNHLAYLDFIFRFGTKRG
jgi:hypothetical protein